MDIDKYVKWLAPSKSKRDIEYAKEIRKVYDSFKDMSLQELREKQRMHYTNPKRENYLNEMATLMVLCDLAGELEEKARGYYD